MKMYLIVIVLIVGNYCLGQDSTIVKPVRTEVIDVELGEKLFHAVVAKDLDKVQRLVEKKNANVLYVRRINEAFYIPVIMQSVMDNSSEVAKYLIQKGADVNAKDGFQMTCLMWAANNGNLELVKLLVEKGADAKAKDSGGITALSAAEKAGHTDIVEFLKR